MDSKVKEVDHGFKAFMHNMHKVSGSYTKVGYPHSKSKSYADGKTVAEIAIDNQFGTKTSKGTVHIPARPFFTNAVDKSKEQLAALTAKQIIEVQDNKKTPKQGITLLGEFMIGKIRKEITDLRTPRNAKITIIAKKGKDNPLIDTGRMRSSTTQEIHMNKGGL